MLHIRHMCTYWWVICTLCMQRVLAIEIGMAGTIRNCKTSGSWRIAGGLLELCHRELPPIITTYFIILGHETSKYTDKFVRILMYFSCSPLQMRFQHLPYTRCFLRRKASILAKTYESPYHSGSSSCCKLARATAFRTSRKCFISLYIPLSRFVLQSSAPRYV